VDASHDYLHLRHYATCACHGFRTKYRPQQSHRRSFHDTSSGTRRGHLDFPPGLHLERVTFCQDNVQTAYPGPVLVLDPSEVERMPAYQTRTSLTTGGEVIILGRIESMGTWGVFGEDELYETWLVLQE